MASMEELSVPFVHYIPDDTIYLAVETHNWKFGIIQSIIWSTQLHSSGFVSTLVSQRLSLTYFWMPLSWWLAQSWLYGTYRQIFDSTSEMPTRRMPSVPSNTCLLIQ